MEQSVKNFNAASALIKQAASNDKFSVDLNENIKAGNVYVRPDTLVLKADVSGASSKHDLLTEETKMVSGISDFTGNRLPKNKGFIFDGIEIGYGTGNAAKMSDGKFNTALPGALLNAKLVIRQLGSVLVSRPVSDFTSATTPNTPNEKSLRVGYPSTLRDDEPLDIQLEFTPGSGLDAAVDPAVNSHLVELKLTGVSTIRR